MMSTHMPALPAEHLADVEWANGRGSTYRFTQVAPHEWVIHKSMDHGFEAHLRRDGSVYDFTITRGMPVVRLIAIEGVGGV